MSDPVDTDAARRTIAALTGWVTVDVLREMRALCDEIDRLQAIVRALDVRSVEVFMSGGGYYHGSGVLTSEQCEAVHRACAAVSPKDGEHG